MAESVGRTIDNLKHDKGLTTVLEINSLVLPEFDKTTTIVSDIFPLHGLITPSEIETLGNNSYFEYISPESPKEEISKIFACPEYTRLKLEQWWGLSDADSLQNFCFYLRYLTYLIQFFKQSQIIHTIHRHYHDYGETRIPDKILRIIVNRFCETTTRNSFIVNDQSKIKLINYICILALSLDKFTTSVITLATDLGLSIAIMKDYLINIGCTISFQKPTAEQKLKHEKPCVATLTAPLHIDYGHRKYHGRK